MYIVYPTKVSSHLAVVEFGSKMGYINNCVAKIELQEQNASKRNTCSLFFTDTLGFLLSKLIKCPLKMMDILLKYL